MMTMMMTTTMTLSILSFVTVLSRFIPSLPSFTFFLSLLSLTPPHLPFPFVLSRLTSSLLYPFSSLPALSFFPLPLLSISPSLLFHPLYFSSLRSAPILFHPSSPPLLFRPIFSSLLFSPLFSSSLFFSPLFFSPYRFRCRGKPLFHFMGTSTFSEYTVIAEDDDADDHL